MYVRECLGHWGTTKLRKASSRRVHWPESHREMRIRYIEKCNGRCAWQREQYVQGSQTGKSNHGMVGSMLLEQRKEIQVGASL